MRRHIARSRFDAISDGVFAIAMTIMVLEIKTPDLGSSSHEAIERYLSGTLPTLGTYAVSFMMLAAMWVSHGRLPRDQTTRVAESGDGESAFSLLRLPHTFCHFPAEQGWLRGDQRPGVRRNPHRRNAVARPVAIPRDVARANAIGSRERSSKKGRCVGSNCVRRNGDLLDRDGLGTGHLRGIRHGPHLSWLLP